MGSKLFAFSAVVKGAIIIALLFLLGFEQMSPLIFLCSLLVLISVDYKNIFILRNYFLVYIFLLFCVAGHYFYPGDNSLLVDMLFYSCAFVLGYLISAKPFLVERGSVDPKANVGHIYLVEKILSLVLLLRVLLFGWDVSQYGISNYYSGYALLFQFESYGKADFVQGLLTIVRHIVDISSLSISVLYVSLCMLYSYKVKYLKMFVLLVVLPFVSLKRSDFALGVMFLLVVSSFGTGALRSSIRNYRRAILGIFMIVAAGVVFGGIRYELLRNNIQEEVSFSEKAIGLISGELTPIVAYQEIKHNIDNLEYQYGGTIFPTLIFKVIPRSWMLDKPTSSSGYFMEKLFPTEASAGYFISSSIFGDMFLNFGFLGVIVFCLLLGVYSARLDATFIQGNKSGLSSFLIVYYHYYILLRGDLQGSLSLIVLTVVMYLLFKNIALRNPLHVRCLHKTIRAN